MCVCVGVGEREREAPLSYSCCHSTLLCLVYVSSDNSGSKRCTPYVDTPVNGLSACVSVWIGVSMHTSVKMD